MLTKPQIMKADRFASGAANQPDLRSVRSRIEQEFSELRQRSPRVLRLAINEAEAVAWETGFVHLFFPVLAEEKARALFAWQSRQSFIRDEMPVLALAE